jgi:hypothetical protein
MPRMRASRPDSLPDLPFLLRGDGKSDPDEADGLKSGGFRLCRRIYRPPIILLDKCCGVFVIW